MKSSSQGYLLPLFPMHWSSHHSHYYKTLPKYIKALIVKILLPATHTELQIALFQIYYVLLQKFYKDQKNWLQMLTFALTHLNLNSSVWFGKISPFIIALLLRGLPGPDWECWGPNSIYWARAWKLLHKRNKSLTCHCYSTGEQRGHCPFCFK